jgi:ribosome-associated toxin RatA of RatAB toxin-antitoxin module
MTFEDSIVVGASPEALFALTQDYGRRLEWDPFLKEARLVGGAAESGVGVRAYCVARSGLAMETEYVSFQPPRVTAVKMTRGPWIIESFAGSWRFVPEGDATRVIFKYQVRARPRWLALLLTPLLTRVFAHDVRKRLAGLKTAVEQRRILDPVTSARGSGG